MIFLSTTGDVLTDPQQAAFERYIQAGGGYVGIHAASDTEYTWPWYGQMLGGYFRNHPAGTPDRDGQHRGHQRALHDRAPDPLEPRRRVVQLPGADQPRGQRRRHRLQPA